MGNKNTAFLVDNYNLGSDSDIGMGRSEVSMILTNSYLDSTLRCFLCGGTAKYRLLPKKEIYNTAQIQDKGYVCEHCLATNSNIDKAHYGIRPLQE
jgi:hypothetical protein